MADDTVIVVGAGIVGLATAWHLQELGKSVVVVDRTGVAAGASWGNAGWLTPALTVPLNNPATMAGGVREVLRPNSPVYVRPTLNPRLARFLSSFLRNSTQARYRRSLLELSRLAAGSLDAYEQLAEHHPELATRRADPHVSAFRTEAGRAALIHEFDDLAEAGEKVEYEELDGSALHEAAPHLGDVLRWGVVTHGQRFIDPGGYVEALARGVAERGGEVRAGAEVTGVKATASAVSVTLSSRETIEASKVVLANGAALPRLARRFGVKAPVQAGRGYSFSVVGPETLTSPLYLPEARVACTPLSDGRLRVAGMMEFRAPDAPLDARRITAIEAAARPLLPGIDWSQKSDPWVGSRPCTPDGLPLLGRTRDPRVFVAGGHGMWGVALGPLSGRLVAEMVAGRREQSTLAPFDPLR